MGPSPSLRSLGMDGGWVVAGVVFSIFGSRGANEIATARRSLDPFGWTLVVVAPVLLLAARHRPRATFAASVVVAAVYLGRNYPGGPIYLVPIVAAAVLGYALPLARSWPPVAAAGVLLVAAASLHAEDGRFLNVALTLLSWLLVPFTPWAVAALLRMNRASARQAVAEQERHERDSERVRLAREVHDVVGHSLAVISMQAGVALHVHERRPEQARVALDAIARSSGDALEELRRTLAVLRGDETAPEPGLDTLDELVDGFVASGQQVTLAVRGARPDPGAHRAHEAAAYRIVQESLTNVVRHAGAAPVRIEVGCEPSGLVVEVRDDGPQLAHTPGPRGGSGLTGMRDRARALGGDVLAGPCPEGGWWVRAELPFRGAT